MFWRRKKKLQRNRQIDILWPIIHKITKSPLVQTPMFFWLGFDTLAVTDEEVQIIDKNQESFLDFLGTVLSGMKGFAIEVEFLRSNAHLGGLCSSFR